VAVRRAEFAHGRIRSAVGVFEFLDRILHLALSAVDGDVRFRIQGLAEHHEFIQPEIIMLDAFPRGVLARRTAIPIAEAVAPVVTAHEIPARPAIYRRIEFLQQRECVRPHPLHVVRGHQGHGPNI
jgi:hypothetical protein